MSNRQNTLFSTGPLALTLMIIVVALTRLIPHPPNFSPIEAMALFGGAYFAKRSWSIVLPLIALFISDLALSLMMGGVYFQYFISAGFLMIYATIALLSILGFGLRNQVSVARVASFSIISSVIFFLVTNFGVWLGSAMYPQTASGLLAAYTAGLPFLQNGLLGTLFYSALLFGSYELLKQRLPALSQQVN